MHHTTRQLAVLCLMGGTALSLAVRPALASPTTYSLLTTIPIPASPDNSVRGVFSSYDLSTVNPSTQDVYVTDRSNAAVDVFSAATNSFVGRLGGSGQVFTGQTANTDTSGPNGVAVVASGGIGGTTTVYAGDGDSTVKVFNVTGSLPQTPVATFSTGNASTDRRADSITAIPQDNRLVVANNAADVPFVSLVNTTTNQVVQKVSFDGTNGTPNAIAGGIESITYDPNNNRTYVAVPQIGTTGPGGITELDPTTGTVTQTFDLAQFNIASCAPTGLVRGVGNQLLIGCDAGQTLIFDPTANGGRGAIVANIPQVFGADQVAYNPTTQQYFIAARDFTGGAQLGIIDAATDSFVENIPTTPGDHSVAVDPVSGEVFLPAGAAAGNTLCPSGCIAVYAPNALVPSVPEPASLALLAGGLGLAAGVARRRRAS